MEENNNNFEFSGFLDNNEVVNIPDKTEKKKGSRAPGLPPGLELPEGMKMEDLKNLLGGMYPINGASMDPNQPFGPLLDILNQLMDVLNEEDDYEEDIEFIDDQPVFDDEEDEDSSAYELAKIYKYLDPKTFGSVECIDNESFYEDYKSKTKRKGVSSILNSKKGSNITNLTNITSRLPFEDIKSLDYIENVNDYSAILYANPKDSDKVGFFMILYQDLNEDFKFLVPAYQNTFKYNNTDDTVELFTKSEFRRLFKDDLPNGNLIVKSKIIPGIKFFTNFTLAVKNPKKYIITAKDVGIFKNIMPSINGVSDKIKVAMMKFNGSEKAELVKGLAGIKDNSIYPFYLKFKGYITKDDLLTLAQLFFSTNFNTCKMLENKEIKNGFDDNGNMYFFVEIDELNLL